MLPFRYQILGHLTVALLLSVLLNAGMGPAAAEPDSPAPFTTQANMLAVTVAVYQDAAPQIMSVQPLNAGRLSVTRPGPYQLVLEDKNGASLYELSFRVAFVVPGLHEEAEEARQVFVLPPTNGATRLTLHGPQGSATHELLP